MFLSKGSKRMFSSLGLGLVICIAIVGPIYISHISTPLQQENPKTSFRKPSSSTKTGKGGAALARPASESTGAPNSPTGEQGNPDALNDSKTLSFYRAVQSQVSIPVFYPTYVPEGFTIPDRRPNDNGANPGFTSPGVGKMPDGLIVYYIKGSAYIELIEGYVSPGGQEIVVASVQGGKGRYFLMYKNVPIDEVEKMAGSLKMVTEKPPTENRDSSND